VTEAERHELRLAIDRERRRRLLADCRPETRRRVEPRPCEVCDQDFMPLRRSNATICSNKCRQAKHRQRQRARKAAA
jgi:hypothetical protein